MSGGAGLYIHIPFCASKCAYCDFCSAPADDGVKRAYVDALIAEIRDSAECFGGCADTVYIGGGTPSCLPRGEIKRISDAVFSCFGGNIAEFTAEANPESFTEEKADEYAAAGITRVSLGVQSTDEGILRFLGRAHDLAQAEKAVREASSRFSLNLDCMLGLPGQNAASAAEFTDFAASCGAEHISAYILKTEEGTPLADRVARGLKLPDEDECADMYEAFFAAARKRGFRRYETSNFAIPGAECRHNLKYWRMDDYIGVGPSAHGKIGMLRYYVPSDIKRYIECADKGVFVRENEEILTPESAFDEYVMTGLRLDEGVDIAEGERRFGSSFEDRYGENVRKCSRYVCAENGFLRIRPQYALVANAVILKIIPQI